ncbi:MAG: hypothetical protein WBP81_38250 [Solirubrobacteraceae bacterium]
MDWKLELIAVPVSDVDRAKAFYTERVGFNADCGRCVFFNDPDGNGWAVQEVPARP